jgi:hypothetical protein
MPPVPNIPNRALTQLNKAALIKLAWWLTLETDGIVLTLWTRIKDYLIQNPDLLDQAQFNHLLPGWWHAQHTPPPNVPGQQPPQPDTPECQPPQQRWPESVSPARIGGGRNEDEETDAYPPSWHSLCPSPNHTDDWHTQSQTLGFLHSRSLDRATPCLEPTMSLSTRFFQPPPSFESKCPSSPVSGKYSPPTSLCSFWWHSGHPCPCTIPTSLHRWWRNPQCSDSGTYATFRAT